MYNTTPENVMKFLEIAKKNYDPSKGKVSLTASLIEAVLFVENRHMSMDEIKNGIIAYCESLQNIGVDFPSRT